MMKRKAEGQSLVEFALVIPLFLAFMVGILDGTRLLFTYNELQEAAHAGARWGSVNVGRLPWGDASNFGNATGTYTGSTSGITLTTGISSTVVGQVNSKLAAVNLAATNIDISSTDPMTQESGTLDGAFRITPVTVTVSYTFVPIISFGHVRIPLTGRATYYHE